jgi:hypothetical protein
VETERRPSGAQAERAGGGRVRMGSLNVWRTVVEAFDLKGEDVRHRHAGEALLCVALLAAFIALVLILSVHLFLLEIVLQPFFHTLNRLGLAKLPDR